MCHSHYFILLDPLKLLCGGNPILFLCGGNPILFLLIFSSCVISNLLTKFRFLGLYKLGFFFQGLPIICSNCRSLTCISWIFLCWIHIATSLHDPQSPSICIHTGTHETPWIYDPSTHSD